MAENINLLPEEMKGKEKKAKEAFKKRKAEPYEISKPELKKKEKKKKKKKEEKFSPHLSSQEPSLQIPIGEEKSAFSFKKHLFHPFKKIDKEERKKREEEKKEIEKKEEQEIEEKIQEGEKEEEKKGEQEEKEVISQPAVGKFKKREEKPKIPEVSLMPEKKAAIPRLVKERILIFIVGLVAIIFLAFIVHLYSLSYFEGLVSQAQIIQGELALKEARIEQLLPQRSKLAQLEKKAKRTNDLLAGHIYWTKLFDFLESYTLPGVSWGDFAANTQGTLQLHGTARDLPTVSQQLVVFSQASDFIEDFTISEVSMGEKAEFTINLKLVPGLFQKELSPETNE